MVKRMVFSPIKILSTSRFAKKERLPLISFNHSLKNPLQSACQEKANPKNQQLNEFASRDMKLSVNKTDSQIFLH
jgi:hypothetical protein